MSRTIVLIEPKCTVCGKPIPPNTPRLHKALTCSPECRDTRELWRRTRNTLKRCHYCEHPASLAERARYKRWRQWERKNPPPDSELSPEEITEREYRKANPRQKPGPKKKTTEEQDGATVSDQLA